MKCVVRWRFCPGICYRTVRVSVLDGCSLCTAVHIRFELFFFSKTNILPLPRFEPPIFHRYCRHYPDHTVAGLFECRGVNNTGHEGLTAFSGRIVFCSCVFGQFFLSAGTTERCPRGACVWEDLDQKHARASDVRSDSHRNTFSTQLLTN